MPESLRRFVMGFVPLAVAVDAISLAPNFIGMTSEFGALSRGKIKRAASGVRGRPPGFSEARRAQS